MRKPSSTTAERNEAETVMLVDRPLIICCMYGIAVQRMRNEWRGKELKSKAIACAWTRWKEEEEIALSLAWPIPVALRRNGAQPMVTPRISMASFCR
jgi:hypothetical protein